MWEYSLPQEFRRLLISISVQIQEFGDKKKCAQLTGKCKTNTSLWFEILKMSETEDVRLRGLLNIIKRYFTSENPDEDSDQFYKEAKNVARLIHCNAATCDSMVTKRSYGVFEENFKGLLEFVKEKSIKPRSTYHGEFIVLVHHDDNFSKQNCLSIIVELAHEVGDTESLERIMRDYRDHPGTGFVMSYLGVIFCDRACYEKAKECFSAAQRCFEQEQDQLSSVIANFNIGILQKVLGHNEEAKQLLDMVADECVQYPEIDATDADLLSRVLLRLAHTFEELGDGKRVQDILAKGIQLLSHVTRGDVLLVPLTRWLMEIQLKVKRGEKVQNEELGKFIDALFASVNKPDEGCSLDADLIKSVLTVARLHGEVHEACKLLKRVETVFAEAYGLKHCLFGSLLYQVGRFHLGGGRINEAEIALKRAEEILIGVFGRNHPTVAACQLSLGTCTCAINKGNVRQALCLLNEAEGVYKKINPEHPEVAEILLKLAVLYVEEGQKKKAVESVKQALDIFKSVCGEVSFKTAGGYFQAGAILNKAEAGTPTAIDAVLKAIDILSILGTDLDCTDMIMCHSLLGVLKLSLGRKKEAEESFTKAAYCDPPDTSTKIMNPEDVTALFKIRAHQVLCRQSVAQIVCLVNLVHLTTGDERNKHFDSLVSWLHDHKREKLVILDGLDGLDFGGQTLSFISHAVFSSWGDAYLIQIVSSDPFSDSPKTDGGLGSDSKPKVFMYATSNLQGNKRPFVLFCASGNPQDMKETRCMDSAFRESVDILFMQPKFRKVFLEGRTLCVELTEQTISPLCVKIDCFPLLVELRLAELYEDLEAVESVVPDFSVISVVPDSAHVFYHSFKFSDQREAEFVFFNLISRLPYQFPLDRDIGLQHVSIAKNMAIFPLQEPKNLVVSIVVQKELIQVKIRLPREHLSSDICSSVTTPIKCIVDSLSDFVDVKSESSLQPSCEHTGEDCLEKNEELSSDYVSMEPTSESEGSLASNSVEIPASSGSSVDSACDEKRRPLEVFARKKCKRGTPHSEIIEQKNCTEVGVCLSLLELLLSKRCTSSGERRPSNVCEETKSDCVGVDISTQDYCDDLNNSLLSLDSAASLNSFPLDCQQGKLCPSTGLSCNATSGALPEYATVLTAQQDEGVLANPSEDDEGCGCLDGKELQTDFDRNVDQCATSDGFPLSGFQAVSNHREGLPVAGTTCSETFEHNCDPVEDSRRVTESICDANLEESRESTDNTLFMKDYIADLENRLSVMQYELLELRPQVSLLEQQAKQAELEKEQALNDLGSHLVSEAREKRRKRIVLSSSECLSHKDSKTKRSCAVSPSHFSTKSNERLLGGEALPRRQRNFSSTGSLHLHQRLLEISNCLSEGELKCMKSLLKRRVNGFKLARIRDVSQLFEELEHREDSPLDVIKDLLLGIGRHDLLEKLAALLCVNREEGPNHVRRPNDCATKRPAAEQKSVVQEPPDSFPSLPELAESRGHGLNLSLGGHGQEMEGVLVQSSSEEESLQSLEEMENLRLGVREPVQVTDPTSLSSSENSNVSDAFSSYVYCSSESPSLCRHTVDEELSHCRKCPGGAMSHNWRCSGDARSLDSVPSPASSTGLVHGMLVDAEVPTSAHGSSVNGSCNHCDTSSAVQWASDEYSAMWKCSKVSSDHTVEQVRIEEEIATHSSERDGNGNKANKKYEDKEVLSKVSESERVQDHELSFHNREVEDRCVCPGRELLDTRESSSTMERDARTVLTEDNQDSSTESTVPLTRSDVGGMTVTLRSTGKQNHMKLLSESMRETHSIDYVDGNADQRIEGPGLLRDRIEEKQFPPSEAPYMLRDSVCGLRDAASRPLPVLLSSNMYLPSPISSERKENGVRSGVEVSPGTNSDEDGKYEVEECDGPVGPTQLPCNSFTPSYDNHENKLFSTEQEASDSPISASSSANSSLILDEQPYTNKEMVSAEGNGPDDSIETDCSLSASEGDRTVDNLAISSGTSDYWQRFGARPRDRKRVQGQQMERQPSPGNASHGKKLQTATFGVANSFLARHSLDQCLHHSLPLDDTEDWMPNEPHLKEEEGAYMDNAVDGASVSATTLSPVGELQELSSELDSAAQTTMGVSSMYGLRGGYDSSVGLRGGHYSSYGLRGGYDSSYGLRGGYDGSVVQSNNPGSGVLTPYLSSVEYSNINMELLPRPMLDYPSATDYTMSNNYPVWNAANNPPLNSIGSGSMSGVSGMLPIMGYDTDLYARTYGFSRQGLYGAASGSRPNQPGMDSSYLPDTLTPGDPFGHPGHQTLAGQRFGSMNEASPTNLFREDVSGRELSNAYSSNTSRSTLTYLEPENSGTSPETSNRTAYSHVTESGFTGLNWSDRLFSLPRESSYSADQSASRGVAAKSRTETSTMTDRSTINPLWNGESNSASNDSPEAPDTSLLALEQRVSEACELVERVLRERQEREQASREVERREREIRAAREREAREREAASRSDHQEAIPGRPQWLCEHYQRHCRVRFPCCEQFYPCHRCHNGSGTCANEETKASHATHLKCAKCNHEQEINEGSQMCSSCGEKMSAYFCPICKHFTGVDKNPYHCEKCGICRIHQDRSFHCEVCNVCLDKRLQGKHKCRPDSGHDECCICLEDAFSGCQILPCSHKVHRECAIAMIQNGIRNCPICRHPLYTPPSNP